MWYARVLRSICFIAAELYHQSSRLSTVDCLILEQLQMNYPRGKPRGMYPDRIQ